MLPVIRGKNIAGCPALLNRSTFKVPFRADPLKSTVITVRNVDSRRVNPWSWEFLDFKQIGSVLAEPSNEVAAKPGEYLFAAVDQSGEVQGRITFFLHGRRRHYGIHIDHLDTAPHNNWRTTHYRPDIALKGIGPILIGSAVQMHFRAVLEVYDDKRVVTVDSHFESADFYEKIGMKHHWFFYTHFAFTGAQASDFLVKLCYKFAHFS